MILLDFLFPKTCVECGKRGSYFCGPCVLELALAPLICPMCGKGSIAGITHVACQKRHGLDGLVAVFSYRDSVQEAVKRIKYRFVNEMSIAFVEAALERLDPSICGFIQREEFWVVPVPLHPARERWRGFNQAALLGKFLAQRLGLEYGEVLQRIQDTPALAELRVRVTNKDREEIEARYGSITQQNQAERRLLARMKATYRKKQMRGAFKVNSKFPFGDAQGKQISNSKILIVDDVWTSGATMLECAKVLKRAGVVRVWGFVFARSGR